MDKLFNYSRLRRAKKTRNKIHELCIPRLTVHKTVKHFYAQIISADNRNVLASYCTVGKNFFTEFGINKKSLKSAEIVGRVIAEKAKEKNINKVAFDRSGFKYHGLIKVFANTARATGLVF